jgi:hypothetical protein
MARTHRTARKCTGRLPIGQLAPQNVPQPQESQPDIPQEASLKEEPFEIELAVPESKMSQGSPAEEQQPEDHGTEDKTDEEHPPSSDTCHTPFREIEMKPPYVCPGCSNHTHGNNMINRCNVFNITSNSSYITTRGSEKDYINAAENN